MSEKKNNDKNKKVQNKEVITKQGRAMAQAVSRRFTIAAALVRAQVSSCWICGGQSGTVVSFL
jgi:hypothetical protein